MKLQRIIQSFLACLLISLLAMQPVHAAADPANIAFVDPTGDINIHQEELAKTISVSIVNISSGPIVLSTKTIGIDDILQYDHNDRTLAPGNVASIDFSLIDVQKSYSGFLVFTSDKGDFIYKAITVDPGQISTAQKGDITLLLADGDISINWADLQDHLFRFQVLNASKDPAKISAELQFLDLDPIVGSVVETPASPFVEVSFDLGNLPAERKSYAGLLVIRNPEGLFLHRKVILSYPASDLIPTSGSKLEFLVGENPITIKYSNLAGDSTFEVELINKGQAAVTITGIEVILPGLVDQAGAKILPPILQSVQSELSIEPFKTGAISLQLVPQAQAGTTSLPPRDGSYSGFLVLTTDRDQALIVKDFTLEVAAIDPKLPTYLEKIGLDIQTGWQKITGSQVRFGPVEWWITVLLLVLLLAGFFALVRLARLWWWSARGRLGPVIVEEIAARPDLTAKLREHLSLCGAIQAPAAPNATIGVSGFVTVVSKSKIPEIAVITDIWNFLAGILGTKFGYTVTSILTGDEKTPPVGVNITIKQAHNGKVEKIKTVQADTYDLAVKNAAYEIFHYISGRKAALRRIPKWSRFPTPKAYRLYKEAKGADDCDEAIQLYEKAAEEAPFNALLRQGWGDSYELKKDFLSALKVYLEAAAIWPELYGFWYRSAALLSFAEVWNKEWEDLEPEEKNTFILLIKNSFGQILTSSGQVTKPLDLKPEKEASQFIPVSRSIWEYLEAQFKNDVIITKWEEALSKNIRSQLNRPADFEPRLPHYYWGYLPFPRWSYGSQLEKAVTIGKFCSILREKKSNEDHSQEVREILEEPWNQGNTYYNAACFYAIRASIEAEITKFEEKEFEAFTKNIKKAEKEAAETKFKADRIKTAVMKLKDAEVIEAVTGFKAGKIREDICDNKWDGIERAIKQTADAKIIAAITVLKDADVRDAITNLKKAVRDPHPGFDIKWVKVDPDLQSLHEDLEFQALFDVPDEEKEKDKVVKKLDAEYFGLILVTQSADEQIELLKKWGKSSGSKIAPEELLAGVNYQIDIWRCLTRLVDKPSDKTNQELFWEQAMLYTDKLKPLPDKKQYPPSRKLSQKELDDCWKAIKEQIQPYPALWEARAAETKLFIEHTKTQKDEVWELWSQAEIRKWEYLQERIKKLPKT